MTPERLAAIKAGAETALDAVHRGWPWPEIDNDLVIGASLKDVPALVTELERLQRFAMELISRYEQAQYAVFAESGYLLPDDEESRFPAQVMALRARVHAAD